MNNQEKDWQIHRCQERHSDVPKRVVSKLFKRAWGNGTHLSTIHEIADMMILVYKETKTNILK